MTDMIWDFEDVIDADTYEKEKYVELRELCKRAGLRTGEILKRMRLEPAPREQPPIPIIATSPPATHGNYSHCPHEIKDGKSCS